MKNQYSEYWTRIWTEWFCNTSLSLLRPLSPSVFPNLPLCCLSLVVVSRGISSACFMDRSAHRVTVIYIKLFSCKKKKKTNTSNNLRHTDKPPLPKQHRLHRDFNIGYENEICGIKKKNHRVITMLELADEQLGKSCDSQWKSFVTILFGVLH